MALLGIFTRTKCRIGYGVWRIMQKRSLCVVIDGGPPKYEIRAMKRSDIQSLYDLLAENQWNMERSYLECVFNTDPTGLVVVVDENDNVIAVNRWNMERPYLECVFNTDPTGLVVVVDENDHVIGHNGILAHSDKLASSGMNIVKEEYRKYSIGKQYTQTHFQFVTKNSHNGILAHSDKLASSGLNIVKEEYRKYGIGKQLFRQVMDVMQERNVGGTSLSNRVTFYAQFGWTIKSYTIHYNAGPVNRDFVQDVNCEGVEIVPFSDVNISDFIAYDSELHTTSRAVYICNWAQWEQAKSYVALRNGRICGYGVLRPADVGHKMFPLYADEPKIARALFAKLVEDLPENEPVVYASAVDNEHSNEFVAANKFTTYLSMTRLYNKRNVPVDLRRVYSVSSTEYAIV